VEKPYIVDDQEAGLFRVNRRTFTDPECLEQERARLFAGAGFTSGTDLKFRTLVTIECGRVAGRPMIAFNSGMALYIRSHRSIHLSHSLGGFEHYLRGTIFALRLNAA
jgi:hypothetical protein